MLCADTHFREGEGGINSEVPADRLKKELEAVQAFEKEWPSYIKVDTSVKPQSGLPLAIQRENFPQYRPLQTTQIVPGIHR